MVPARARTVPSQGPLRFNGKMIYYVEGQEWSRNIRRSPVATLEGWNAAGGGCVCKQNNH